MKPDHVKVLKALDKGYREPAVYEIGLAYFNFKNLTRATGFNRAQVRRICRYLARKKFAQYGRGLWTEEGEPAGSGYAITAAGHNLIEILGL